MTEPNIHSHSSHKLLNSINPPITNTKTPIISTNKPLSNVTTNVTVNNNSNSNTRNRHISRRKQSKHSKHNKHISSQHISNSKLPPIPTVDPLWEPVAIINKQYAMGPKIGSGSFGSVHAGLNIKDNYRYLAIKLEPIEPNHHPQLEREYKIYKEIHSNKNINKQSLIRIPKIFYFGRVEGHPFNALVMDMLGPSLKKLFNLCNRKFSLKTVLMIADQMLSRLEFIHDNGYLHRDLKPDNFLMGMYNSEIVVYVVDLGLAKSYIDKRNNRHIPYTEGKTLTGTARYASVNTYLGVEQSRRDDLESLGYISWQSIKAKTRHSGILAHLRHSSNMDTKNKFHLFFFLFPFVCVHFLFIEQVFV